MAAFQDVVDRALRVAAPQLPHIAGALLDLARDVPSLSEWNPRPDPSGAAWARLRRDRAAAEDALEWGLAAAALVAPLADLLDWRFLIREARINVIAAIVPFLGDQALRERVRGSLEPAVARPLLGTTVPVFRDDVERFESAATNIADPQTRRLVLDGLRGLPTGDTAVLRSELEASFGPGDEGVLTAAIERALRQLSYSPVTRGGGGFPKPPPEAGPVPRAPVGPTRPGMGYGGPPPPVMPHPGPRGPAPPAHQPGGPGAQPQRANIGFAREDAPAQPDPQTLAVSGRSWLWVEIGPDAVAGAIAAVAALPAVAAGDELDVVVYDFPGQLGLDDDQRRGAVRLQPRGPAVVTRPAAQPAQAAANRLYFRIQTPAEPGRYSVRVHVYFRGLLLQAHLVTAQVTAAPAPATGALAHAHVVDYALTQGFDLAALRATPAHGLSILVNDDGGGTHGFRFFGADGFTESASIDGAALAGLLDYARGGLREVAWGSRDRWTSPEKTPYRYAAPTPQQLGDDLCALAVHGYRLWAEALAAFGVRGHRRQALQRLMRAPAPLQLALKASASHVFPASLVYDHPLRTTAAALTLCPRFLAALDAGEDLEATPCFRGRCPSWGDEQVVCPSGFWGFRHDLGVPLHLGKRGEVAPVVLAEARRVMIGVSTDPRLARRAAHVAAVRAIDGIAVDVRDDRDGCMQALAVADPVKYFYCHGGITPAGTPYLEVGAPKSEPITADSLVDKVWWEPRRPLVVLNGCHTTAATPEEMFSLAQAFVVHANAAGVIGTEVTVFEALATTFGEVLLREVFAGATVGAAVRRARLALLGAHNPLGLVYIPFALATLRLSAG